MIRHRFTVEACHKAYQAGAPPERVEPVAGEVYAASPMGKEHRLHVMHLDRVFQEAFGDGGVVMVRCPLALPPDSEPVPNLVLLRPPLEAYRERDPLPEDVLLLVEISETTLLKLPLYRQAGLPEVWIVNLLEGVLEVHAFPHHLPERRAKGEKVAPKAFPTRALKWWV